MALGVTCPLLSTGQAPQRCNLQPSSRKARQKQKALPVTLCHLIPTKLKVKETLVEQWRKRSKENSIPQLQSSGSWSAEPWRKTSPWMWGQFSSLMVSGWFHSSEIILILMETRGLERLLVTVILIGPVESIISVTFVAFLFCCFAIVFQSLCPTLCNPIDCSTPGLPVPNYSPESSQVCIHWISDAIQPSHLLSSPSPFAFNLFQHQGLF